MKKQITYVGLDVDSKAFHGHCIRADGENEASFAVKADIDILIAKLRKIAETENTELKVCYEAAFPGFVICRRLRAAGIDCVAIAPSLIPKKPGKRVKTDRLDAEKLAHFFRQGLLTKVYVPDEENEEIRDLLRSRRFLVNKLKDIRKHIVSAFQREDLNYKRDNCNPHANYWTSTHKTWMLTKIKQMEKTHLAFTVSQLISLNERIEEQIQIIEVQITKAADSEKYKPLVESLLGFRGIDTLLALTIVTEIGDINRFSHPRKLASYIGLDIVETSSGGCEKKFGISKMGNPILRTALVEACQFAIRKPNVSRYLRLRRQRIKPKFVEIGDRCMSRLYKKGTRLLFRGKPSNKIKVACAREMTGFLWEALREAAA